MRRARGHAAGRRALTLDHLPPGTRPQDVDPQSGPPIPPERAAEAEPRHREDTHGAGPTAERPHLEGPEQNPM